jgi:chorismate synthase
MSASRTRSSCNRRRRRFGVWPYPFARYHPAIARFEYTTAGESHGPELTAILVGMPSGLMLDAALIEQQLARRQGGYGRSPRQRLEQDSATITGGVRHGCTMGGPISLRIANRDHANWDHAMSVWPTESLQGNWRDRPIALPRPGHADLAGMARGAFTELRPVLERASARETAARVAVGAIAQQLLGHLGVHVCAHVRSVGDVDAPGNPPSAPTEFAVLDSRQMRCLDAAADARMVAHVDEVRARRDTCGGVVEVIVYGLPPGLGGYVTARERLDGRLAGAAMSVQAMKGVEFGAGMELARRAGSAAHDEIWPCEDSHGSARHGMGITRRTNHAGGIEGGMSNGAPVVLRIAMKPLPTLMQPLASVDLAHGEPAVAHAERSDTCAVPAAAVVLEAVIALEVAAVIREHFGMQALSDVSAAWNSYCERVAYPCTLHGG